VNDLLQLPVGQLAAERLHDVAQLGGRDGAVAVAVEQRERFRQLGLESILCNRSVRN
jgi:hypothetical protein